MGYGLDGLPFESRWR